MIGRPTYYTNFRRCPIFSLFVRRYRLAAREGRIARATRSTTSRPYSCGARIFAGLLDKMQRERIQGPYYFRALLISAIVDIQSEQLLGLDRIIVPVL